MKQTLIHDLKDVAWWNNRQKSVVQVFVGNFRMKFNFKHVNKTFEKPLPLPPANRNSHEKKKIDWENLINISWENCFWWFQLPTRKLVVIDYRMFQKHALTDILHHDSLNFWFFFYLFDCAIYVGILCHSVPLCLRRKYGFWFIWDVKLPDRVLYVFASSRWKRNKISICGWEKTFLSVARVL